MDSILIADASRYAGQYVTTEDFGKTTVISSSKSAVQAYKEAITKGFLDPVIIYVPAENEREYACS